MRLEYQITASDTQLRRVLRGVEQEARSSSRRIGRETQAAMNGPGRAQATQARRFDESQSRAVARAQESLDRQRSRAVLSNIKAEERERIRADRTASSAAESLDKQRSRGLMQQIREQERAQAKANSMRARSAERIGHGAARSVMGVVGTVARIGGAALGLIGGFSAAGAIEDQFAIRRKASMLANQSEDPGAKGAIAKEAMGNRGFTGEESLDFLTNFHEKSGDLGAARGAMKDMAELALATGTNFEELGSAAGSAFTVIRDQVKNPQERLSVLKEVMTAVAQQGSMGAIEMRNLVDGMSELGGATRSFQGGPARILKSMGGLAQMALQRGGAGSPEEAVTAVARFATDIPEHGKEFAKQDIGIYADKGHTQLRAPEQILADMLQKTGGDLGKMGELFGVRSQKVARGLSPLYGQAERENAALPAAQRRKKGEAGKAAVLAEFERFAGATRSEEELKTQAESRLNDPDLQVKETMKQFNAAVGTELIPVLMRMLPQFAEAIPAIGKFTSSVAGLAEWLMDNPIKGVGAIIAASVAKDVASAGIGSLLARLLTMAAGGGGGGAAGGAGGAVGGVAGGGLAAGVAAVAGVAAAVDQAQDLAKDSGGWSGVYAGVGGVLAGRGYAGGVDDYMNEQARGEKYFTPGAGGTVANGLGTWWGANPTAPGQGPAKPGQSMQAQVKELFGSSTKDLQSAAKDISAAAATLKANANTNGRDPRGAPIKPG